MASAKSKQKAFVLLGIAAGLGLMFAGTKEAKAKAAQEDDDEPQSPGWPDPWPTQQQPPPGPPPVNIPLPGGAGPIVVQPSQPQQPLPDDEDDGTTSIPLPSGTVQLPGGGSVTLPGGSVEIPDVVEMPDVQQGPPPSPTMEQAEQPTELPADTAKLLQVMLALESTSNWKRVEPTLKPWQSKRGLVADGKFGPKSALRMGAETGLLPIVRFWTAGTSPESAVPAYHDGLVALAQQAEEPRATQLYAAVEREQGQAFARNVVPVVPTISLA